MVEVEIASAPADKAAVASLFVSISPPAIIGKRVVCASEVIALEAMPGRTSKAVGEAVCMFLCADLSDDESRIKSLKIVFIPRELACLSAFGLVEIRP